MINKPNEDKKNQKLLQNEGKRQQLEDKDPQQNIKKEKQQKKIQKNKIGSGVISPKAYAAQSPDMNLNVQESE